MIRPLPCHHPLLRPENQQAPCKAFPILESSSFVFTEPFQRPRRGRLSKYLIKVSALAILAAKSSVFWALPSLFFSAFSGFSAFSAFLSSPAGPALGAPAFFFAFGSLSFLSLPAPVQPKKFSLESESEDGSAPPSSSSGSGALPSASASSSYHGSGTSAMQAFFTHVKTKIKSAWGFLLQTERARCKSIAGFAVLRVDFNCLFCPGFLMRGCCFPGICVFFTSDSGCTGAAPNFDLLHFALWQNDDSLNSHVILQLSNRQRTPQANQNMFLNI